jgi:hypothetical protein
MSQKLRCADVIQTHSLPYPDNARAAGPPVTPLLPAMPSLYPAFFNLRRRSLLRGSLLVMASVFVTIPLSDWPRNRATPWLLLPLLCCIAGSADTARCIRRRWNWYHAGVIICLYMDLMALAIILFFLIYPYAHFFELAR